jgi:flagellar motor switch protein FliN/FliY
MKDSNAAQKIKLSEVDNVEQDQVILSQRDYQLVKSVPVKMDVELGSIELSVDRLFSLKSGEILMMDKEVDATIDLVIDGKTIAVGNLVALDGFFGIEITNIQE